MKIHTTEVQWYDAKVRPDYQAQICGGRSVSILIFNRPSTFPGRFADGKWYILGVEVPEEAVDLWCYYPEPPK